MSRRPAPRLRFVAPRLADVSAGVGVALIALPQALAYAELAGMPPVTGLWAIVPALLLAAPFLSAKELQVGPVATTSLLAFGTLSALAAPGSPEWVGLAALLALLVGTIRIAIGLLGWGRLAYLLSRPVRIGFLNGAALLIAASQLPATLGVEVEGGVIAGAWHAVTSPGAWRPAALAFALGTIAVVHLGRRLHPLVPGVLVAVVGSLAIAVWSGYGGPVVGGIAEGWPRPRLDLPWSSAPRLVVGALVLALVGFSEAASIGRDLAARARRPWNPDREFVAQGVANLGAGAFGGFPVGASFSRSAVNRMAGATSRWSGFVTGLTLLAALPAASLLAPLPKATLAGVILGAVSSLIRPGDVLTVLRASRSQGVIAMTTFALTLALAPRIDEAVLIGVLLAAGQHLRREQNLRIETAHVGDALYVIPRGVLWYGSAQRFEEAVPGLLAAHPEADELVVDLAGCGRVDWSAATSIREALEDAEAAGMRVRLTGVPFHARRWLATVWSDVRVD
ncbi:MAG: SulP family inorganic anion transporter [Trueperaceae bacterium]|nr:SulP family inorganic anion transporter [Trueperaceae bacterium]